MFLIFYVKKVKMYSFMIVLSLVKLITPVGTKSGDVLHEDRDAETAAKTR